MKYLSPEIQKLSENTPQKSLAKPGVSCGIFQDCFDKETKYTQNFKQINSTPKNR